eukprot:TRINITY_DN11526_c0_g1_i1.p1 TRINITY_DN11526_c0_g1~~TRINITY_DN11526_c0_g1_i1.p1  ORF type:complete len:216 (-),score=32.70 TRINITY_DN11526_c0_g1_i1:98-745(-)
MIRVPTFRAGTLTNNSDTLCHRSLKHISTSRRSFQTSSVIPAATEDAKRDSETSVENKKIVKSLKDLFPYHMDLPVRGYEIDSFGHVNNAVYLSWLEHARWQMALDVGGPHKFFGSIKPVVRRVEVDYLSECKMGDTVRITYWPRSASTTSFVFGSRIKIIDSLDPKKKDRIALKATIVQTATQTGVGKVPLPEFLKEIFPQEDPGAEPSFLNEM